MKEDLNDNHSEHLSEEESSYTETTETTGEDTGAELSDQEDDAVGEKARQHMEALSVEEETAAAEEMRNKEIRAASEGKFGRLINEEGGRKKLTGMYKEWFLDYASYVILERAVPHVEDGLKPVQRRILHAMKKLDDGRYNKVANIIGSTNAVSPAW